MDFRIMTAEDLAFVDAHLLYPDERKERKDDQDFNFALQHGDYVLGVGGFRMITDTTAWAWVQLTSYVGHHIIPTIRVITEYMDGYYLKDGTHKPGFCKKHGILRLQAFVRADFPEGHRLVEHLGYFREGPVMKDFCGKGIDAHLYVKHYDGE